MIRLRFILLFAILLLGCKKDKNPETQKLAFEWVQENHKLTFNYYSPDDTTLDALVLNIILNPGNTNLRFKWEYPIWFSASSSKWVGSDYNVFRQGDGLYTSAYSSCNWGGGFTGTFNFIRAPLAPKLNDFYPDYLCADEIYTAYKVVETNKTIAVPLGNFDTFVLQDTLTMRKEYWSEKDGVIMIELFDTTGALSGQYQLTSKNY